MNIYKNKYYEKYKNITSKPITIPIAMIGFRLCCVCLYRYLHKRSEAIQTFLFLNLFFLKIFCILYLFVN